MSEGRPTWDEFYLGMARYTSIMSKDPSTKVGAVIVRPDKSLCSIGFNGFPQKMPDMAGNYSLREEKYSRIIHGEINAARFSREQMDGYTLYTYPFMPCDRCFVQMVQYGITRVVFPPATADQLERWGAAFDKVRQYARECGIEMVELSLENQLPV